MGKGIRGPRLVVTDGARQIYEITISPPMQLLQHARNATFCSQHSICCICLGATALDIENKSTQ